MKAIYFESIISKALEAKIIGDQEYNYVRENIGKENAGIYIQKLLNRLLHQVMRAINSSANDENALPQLSELCNQLIQSIASIQKDDELLSESIISPPQVLKAKYAKIDSGIHKVEENIRSQFPITGFNQSVLFSGGKDNVSLESELRKEMLSSDEIYWLVSFIKFEGIRLFESTFRELERLNVPIKIICTVYMGATDPKAIQFLSQFQNIEIKISYNTNLERLHAKSYIFKRQSDFNTAYIGSSNLSRSAMTNGLEWNLKITSQEVPHVIQKCLETFNTYWNDKEFHSFKIEDDWDKLVGAINRIRHTEANDTFTFVELTPFEYQKEILEQLAHKRAEGQHSNLVVAATGTGKTVIAAFDFKNILSKNPQTKFLFVAHREEILKQAQFTFRQVLRDADFGELFYGGRQANSYHHLFATIQTMNSRLHELALIKEFYDYIIIDEVHHSAAKSYEKLLNYFQPKQLLGLTATPERTDGDDITRFFANNISAEIRLPEALNRRLLCPFQYFGISDTIDLSRVSWRKGKYDINELENVYTEDKRRVLDIIRNCEKYLRSMTDVRAIGFCVSIKHAQFMQKQFEEKGIKAGILTSLQAENRNAIIQQLRRREINFLFVVDILNEGVDIPEVDTLLFLRPTESMTIFLQQLGRGLRTTEGKEYLTVLDFIGQSHVEYSFEHKFRGMLGKTHTRVVDELENDFPHLPLGCSIILEKQAKEIILQNITRALRGNRQNLLRRITQFKQDFSQDLSLTNFTNLSQIALQDIYKYGLLFTELVAESNQATKPSFKDEIAIKKLAECMGSTWLSCDSPNYWRAILSFITNDFSNCNEALSEQYLLMIYADLFTKAPQCSKEELAQTLKDICCQEGVKQELIEYLNIRIKESEVRESSYEWSFSNALQLHGRYNRNQILIAMGISNLNKLYPSREGVLDIKDKGMECFFVTLDKTDWRMNASTKYHDYFINEELFHWQSQNATSETSTKGLSYIHHMRQNKQLLLFIRERTEDEHNNRMSFIFCGSLQYESHTENKPMNINWKLNQSPPAALVSEGRKLAIG